MGGKKKNLANKLAKMSDEERARYAQHKADLEEEAKKRKEQLISTFLKNKIKKEEAFARLNLAKINQHWHQILRFKKCKEMKEDVEHMKDHISRVVNYKNRTIQKLLQELEMAEEQYGHNYQTHMTHLDSIIGFSNKHLNQMNEQFKTDLEELLMQGRIEQEEITTTSTTSCNYIKTITFAKNKEFELDQAESKERYLCKKEDATSTFRQRFESFVKGREKRIGSIWRRMAQLIAEYVRQSDTRRFHLAELRRLDDESSSEIAKNQERIIAQEAELSFLSEKLESLRLDRTEKVTNLQKRLTADNSAFQSARQSARSRLDADAKRLFALAAATSALVAHLSAIARKGGLIAGLASACGRLQTERELAGKWLPICVPAASPPAGAAPAATVERVVLGRRGARRAGGGWPAGFAYLARLEHFGQARGRAAVELRALRAERARLRAQNERLRRGLRGALEAAALASGATRAGARSAPVSRISI